MKTAPRYICRISNRDLFRRCIWWAFVRFCLNADRYRVRVRFNGPRKRWAYSTRKADATGRRFYLEDREEERARKIRAQENRVMWARRAAS